MDEADGSLTPVVIATQHAATLTIELCIVDGDGARLQRLLVPAGATVADALMACGMQEATGAGAGTGAGAVAGTVSGLAVALHGRRVPPDRVLRAGDRIELLAPLVVDPKLARQRRADKRRRESGDERWQRGQGARV
jgi:uncharacterized protein